MSEPFPFVLMPLNHQWEEWKYRDVFARAYFWEMGLGKSKAFIDKAAYLYMKGEIDVVVIIALNGSYTNWKYVELPEHMPKEVDYVCEVFRSGLKEKEKQAIRELCKPQGRLRILCVNVESMPFMGGEVTRAFVKSRRVGLKLGVDECTAVKSHKAARSKEVYKVAEYAKYRTIMTGSPVTRSPIDLWGQCKVLGKNMLGHSSLTSFKNSHQLTEMMKYGPRSFPKVVGYKDIDKINRKLLEFSTIFDRETCLDLPSKIYKKVAVPMSDRQATLYSQMRDEALAELEDGEIVEAVNALGIISRLDQIACGQLKREDGTYEILSNSRLEVLTEHTDNTSKKGIIWCNYRGLLQHFYKEMTTRYGENKVARFYGGVPDAEREVAVRRFQDKGDSLQWIVANQQSMGYGRTLTTGKENYYVSNGHNLEHRLQSEDRTMRIGQDESVFYLDMFTPNTANDRVLYLLRQKRELAGEVLGTRLRDWI